MPNSKIVGHIFSSDYRNIVFMANNRLLEKAKHILLMNHREGFTLPSTNIYPYQWKWDSGFVALGFIHFNLDLAMSEMRTLFKAQWSNGFLPHIIFHDSPDEKKYFPNAEFYSATLSPESNKTYQTTTLTQPPIEGWVLERIFKKAGNNPESRNFVQEMFPKILAEHEYLYNNRDPFDEGLVYIQHNWESGTDNSPVWDEIWASFDAPYYNFERKDTQHVEESQRPHQREYDYYLYLIDLFKACNYHDQVIAEKSPFLVQDPLFNSMLMASNNSLIRLAAIAGFPEKEKQLKAWNRKSIQSFNNKLYDEKNGIYRHYDLRRNKWLDGLTSSGFAPLYAGIPSVDRVEQMISVISRFSKEGQYFLCPSFDPDDIRFEPQRYWRGPVWVNMNWLIYEGLKSYGKNDWARKIKEDTLQMVREQGFSEYFEPDKEKSKKQTKGYGGSDFSWTASLIIDFLNKKT